MTAQSTPPMPLRRRRASVLACALAATAGLSLAVGATAQDLQGQLDQTEAELHKAEETEGVLSTTIERYSGQIDQLTGEVAALRNREAIVQEQLAETEAELERAKDRLEVLRERLQRSLGVLRERLVSIYKSDEPDVLTVILQSNGFDDLLDRYEYLDRIQQQDSAIVVRVRDLRNETEGTVQTIRAAREAIEDKQAELERTRMQLEAREAQLDEAREDEQTALADTRVQIERLEGDISDLEGEIQAQLRAAAAEQAAAAESAVPEELPAQPVQGESSSGFIWPLSGPVTSPFGMRWGRMHEGIDIAVPSGTPIRAVSGGQVAIAAPTGGYGNYTCVNHGGSLSSCYAHQSSYSVGVGDSVGQGQVIGYSGCTGSCFGDHLHFEVRVNGAAVDPMGYL